MRATIVPIWILGVGVWILAGLVPLRANTSGLDVQLKDLRGSFYFTTESLASPETTRCLKLKSSDIKSFGRLIHCHPEGQRVRCPLKNGNQLFAMETENECKAAIKERQNR